MRADASSVAQPLSCWISKRSCGGDEGDSTTWLGQVLASWRGVAVFRSPRPRSVGSFACGRRTLCLSGYCEARCCSRGQLGAYLLGQHGRCNSYAASPPSPVPTNPAVRTTHPEISGEEPMENAEERSIPGSAQGTRRSANIPIGLNPDKSLEPHLSRSYPHSRRKRHAENRILGACRPLAAHRVTAGLKHGVALPRRPRSPGSSGGGRLFPVDDLSGACVGRGDGRATGVGSVLVRLPGASDLCVRPVVAGLGQAVSA